MISRLSSWRLWGTLAGLLALIGCASIPAFLPDQQLAASAALQFDQMKAELRQSTNTAYVAKVDRIGRRIAAVAGNDIVGADWEFVVFEDPAVNAFAMPGGKVAVFTGLIELVGGDEDQLAVVMGHEVAHVGLRHSNKQMSSEMVRQMGGVGLAILLSRQEKAVVDPQLAQQAYDLGTQVGLMLPYSREHELEADRLGLYYAAKAGYDPEKSIALWEKMAEASAGAPPEFMSTHPSHGTRIERLRELIPEVKARVASEGGPVAP